MKYHSMPGTVLGLSAFLFVVTSCEQREEAGELAEVPEVEEVAPVMAPAEESLETVNESGVSGTVRMTHLEREMEIGVSVDGAIEGQSYVAHLHRGECGNDLGVVTTIGEFTATAGENHISTTVDLASLDETETYFVQVHGANQAPVACAPLPGHGPDTVSPAGAKTSQKGETY